MSFTCRTPTKVRRNLREAEKCNYSFAGRWHIILSPIKIELIPLQVSVSTILKAVKYVQELLSIFVFPQS